MMTYSQLHFLKFHICCCFTDVSIIHEMNAIFFVKLTIELLARQGFCFVAKRLFFLLAAADHTSSLPSPQKCIDSQLISFFFQLQAGIPTFEDFVAKAGKLNSSIK